MSEITPADLAEIKAACDAATLGPWEADGFSVYANTGEGSYDRERIFSVGGACLSTPQQRKFNGNFSAHARTWIPRLVEEVERLNYVIARMAE